MKTTNHSKKEEIKRTQYNNKLTKTEFYDVYGISLAHKNTELSDKYLLSLLLPIAQKYYDITYHALTSELRYFLRGAGSYIMYDINPNNEKLLKKLKIKNWKSARKKLTLTQIYILFHSGDWEEAFGGEKWAKICLACKELYNAIQNKKIEQVCHTIDRLNDLEHNNNLYLAQYSTFNLFNELNFKFEDSIDNIYSKCSPAVEELKKFSNPC